MIRKSPFFDENLVVFDKNKLQKEIGRYYSLPSNEKKFPEEAYLILPGNLKAQRVEILNKHQIRIHIWYRESFRGLVNMHMQMSYDVIRKGSILCKGVKSYHTLPFEQKSKINNTFANIYKIITFPIGKESTIQIKCRTLKLESIGNYVLHAGRLVSHNQFLEMVAGMKA